MTKRFEVGKTYSTRSISDHETVYSFKILARTSKTVTTDVEGKTVRRGLSIYNGHEQFKPFGSYSMCTIIGADREAPDLGNGGQSDNEAIANWKAGIRRDQEQNRRTLK